MLNSELAQLYEPQLLDNTEMAEPIQFTEAKYLALRKAYNKAVANGVEVFTFEGQEVVTAYAKYMLEYLEQFFK